MKFLVLIFSFLLSPFCYGADLYTLILPGCKLEKGIFVHVDKEKLQMLGLDGRLKSVDRDKIKFVVIHNTYENPIADIAATPQTKALLKTVYVQSTDKVSFVGWPIKFIDELVVFFDISGRQHVLELNKILRIRPYTETANQFQLTSVRPKLSYGDSIGSCREQLPAGKGLIPTRVLGDQIQISEFLNNFEKGYERVDSYEERTYLYHKPILWDEPTKAGVTLYQKSFANPKLEDFPVYFQWSTGRPYRFQSFTQLGYLPVDYLPTLEPLLVAKSEVKSHFFRGSFVGNLSALPAGSEYYTQFVEKKGSVLDPTKVGSGVAINYMALMGGDYENWSLSIGSSYNTYYIQAEDYFREILGSALTPVVRLMYSTKYWQFFAIAGQTDLGADNPSDLQVSFDRELSVVGFINSFNFESRFIRGGLKYEWGKKTYLGANFLYLEAKYDESLATNQNNFFNWNSKNVQVYFHKQFGEYVGLKVFANSFNYDYDSEVASQDRAGTFNKVLTGGSFEFVF